MQADTNAVNNPLNTQQEITVIAPQQAWNNDYACTVVNKDFSEWESYRQQNHDKRFQNSDQLFLAWCPQKVWDGTRIPRSSLGNFLTMQQEETLLDSIMAAIFPLEDNVEPIPMFGTSMFQARLAFMLIMEQMRNSEDGYSTIREVIRRTFKQGFLYGNGIMEVSWQYVESIKNIAVPVWESATYNQMYSSMYGSAPKRHLAVHAIPYVKNQPMLSSIDIRDFYIDPHTNSPNIQKARGCAVRQLVTKEDIAKYRGMATFDVPSDTGLQLLVNAKNSTVGDQSKQIGESYRAVNYSATNDYTGNPNDKRLELIRYFNHNRNIWILNRKWIMYNQPNALGCLPFLNSFYIDVPNHFYGLSMADVCEPEQRLQQSIINARIDELALSIHSPFVKKRGDGLQQGALRMVPGKVIELESPADFKKLEWPNITQQAYLEVSASEQRNQKTTGLTDTASFGVGSAGGNSANRTATGVNSQVQAAGKRIAGIVNNLDSNFIEPLFDLLHRYNRTFLNPEQVFNLIGIPQGVNPLAVIHADVRFRSQAGRKMQTRSMILQVMPQLLPFLLNPEVMNLLAQQSGMVLDIKAVMDDMSDALNVGEMQWFRQMNPQEVQAATQMNPNVIKAQTAMQMQQQRLQAQGEHQEAKGDTQLLAATLPAFTKNYGVQKAATGYDPEPPQKKTVKK
jgi:hypothetical protein